MEKLIDSFVPIGVLLTFITSLISIHFTRRNLKTAKYIDTITSERIKWLELIRTEGSEIVSNIYFSINLFSETIRQKESIIDGELNNDEDPNQRYFEAEIKSALKKENIVWTRSDFIRKITIFKLRLNPEEDVKIVNTLNWFIEIYQDKDSVEEEALKEMRLRIDKFTLQIQLLLKSEWEKVKNETKGQVY